MTGVQTCALPISQFSPRRLSAKEKWEAEQTAEERKYGMSSREAPASSILNEGEFVSRAINEIVREETPTLVGKLGTSPELEQRLTLSQRALEQAAQEDVTRKAVNKLERKKLEIKRRQAAIQQAVANKEATGELGPVEVGSPKYKKMFELKELEDLPGGTPARIQPELKVTPEQLRQVFRNLDVEEFPTPVEPPPAVTDLISSKMPRTEITHRTVLGNIQSEAAKAAKLGDIKIEKALAAMAEKRENIFDAELARIRNKFKTMELEGRAEAARQARMDADIVQRRAEHFASVREQIAQAQEPAPLNAGTPEPPAQTLLPNIATAADDVRIPRDFVIQNIRGKYKIWSIGRQALQAVTDTYQDALKKAQEIHLKRYRKRNAA